MWWMTRGLQCHAPDVSAMQLSTSCSVLSSESAIKSIFVDEHSNLYCHLTSSLSHKALQMRFYFISMYLVKLLRRFLFTSASARSLSRPGRLRWGRQPTSAPPRPWCRPRGCCPRQIRGFPRGGWRPGHATRPQKGCQGPKGSIAIHQTSRFPGRDLSLCLPGSNTYKQ